MEDALDIALENALDIALENAPPELHEPSQAHAEAKQTVDNVAIASNEEEGAEDAAPPELHARSQGHADAEQTVDNATMVANEGIDADDAAPPELHEAAPARAEAEQTAANVVCANVTENALGLSAAMIASGAIDADDKQWLDDMQGAVDLPGSFVRRPQRVFRMPEPGGGVRTMQVPRRRPASDMALDDSMGAANARNVRHASEDATIAVATCIAEQPGDVPPAADAQMVPVPASQEDDDAMMLATQNGSALPVYEDKEAGFVFEDLTRADTGAAALTDPLEKLLQQINDCQDMTSLRSLIHPQGLFADLNSADKTYATVREWLNQIKSDHRNHCELSQASYSIKLLVPIPFAVAIQTVSLAEGWPPEALAIAIGSNVGWLEHHGTRLKQRRNDAHSRGQNIGFFQGMDPSMRKSSLKTFVTQTCLQGANILTEIRDGTATCVDGTIKGHRNCILNTHRSGIEADEVTGAYQCSSGDRDTQRGMHFAPREKILGFVNGERDSVCTADGTITLAGYSFAHRVWGQIPALTKVLIPKGVAGSLGFPKRFAISFHRQCDKEPDQQCAASKKFLLDFHDWLGLHATPTQREPYMDNFALTMHCRTLQAAGDFLEEDGATPLFRQKVGFADTDLCRWSNVVMRMEQYLEELPACRIAEGHTRLEMSVYNHAYANHYCYRQWQQHHALYMERDEVGDAASGGGRGGSGGSGGTGGNAGLTEGDFVMKAMLEAPRFRGRVSTGDMRMWLRNRLMHRGVKDVAKAISAAAEKLVEVGVLTAASVPAAEPTALTRRPRGRRVSLVQKASNFGTLGVPARELLSRLKVSAECFEDP